MACKGRDFIKIASANLGMPKEEIDYVFEAKRKGIMLEISGVNVNQILLKGDKLSRNG
jgi:hypothetical protein